MGRDAFPRNEDGTEAVAASHMLSSGGQGTDEGQRQLGRFQFPYPGKNWLLLRLNRLCLPSGYNTGTPVIHSSDL